jgi:hypothetical protein
VKGIQVYSNKGNIPSPRGDDIERVKMLLNLKKNLLLQNQ